MLHDRADPDRAGDDPEVDATARRLRPPVTALAWAWSVPVATASERLVLVGLAMHADRHGCTIVGQRTLARRCGLGERTVRGALRALTERGILARIARMTRHGGRTTDAVLFAGWPERVPLPDGGHPRWGHRVAETLDMRLAQHAAARERQPLPGGPAAAAGQEHVSLTRTDYRSEADGDLRTALEALGPWATPQNRALLCADRAVLAAWRGQGLDIGRDLAPILAQRARAGRPPPVLRTWAYFGKAVAPLLQPGAAAPVADRGPPAAGFVTDGLLRGLVKSAPVRRPWRDGD